MTRKVQIIMTGWQFALGGREAPPDMSAFTPVNLPHDWTINRTAEENAPLGGSQGFFRRGDIGWYRRTLTMDAIPAGCRFYLDFGGIFECSAIWLNGVCLGGQRYGYTPFRLDGTAAVRPGENELLIRVDNTQEPADRWYSGCGIYRTVRWMLVPDPCLDERRITVTTTLDGGSATVHIETGTQAEVTAALSTPEGRLAAQGAGCGQVELTVASPQLWNAEHPCLYTLNLSRADSGDTLTLRIGLRTAVLDNDRGLLVNGEPTVLRGVCVHQDMGCMGIAATPEMWRARLQTLKEMGCNAIRAAHHVHSEEFLDLCDEMGFYVYAECFDKWRSGLYGRYFDTDWQHDMAAMILRDRNRPSILLWGVGNEVEDQGQPAMIDTLRMLVDYAHSLDNTRPVTYAMNPHFKRASRVIDYSQVKDIQQLVDEVDDREITDLDERIDCIAAIAEHVDILSCNYQEQWYDEIHRRLPDKLILGTEIYQYFMGHRDSMQDYVEHLPALVPEQTPYVIGGMIWTGYDYLGESMGWPCKGWPGSILRTNGYPRFSYYLLKSCWTKEPMVHMAVMDHALMDEFVKEHWACPHYEAMWDFPALHRGLIPYMVATNCERVEVLTQGRHFYLPNPSACPNGIITGYLPYEDAEWIKVIGFIDDEIVCTQVLKAPGPVSQLRFDPVGTLPAQEGYHTMVTVQATDAQGERAVHEARPVTFRVTGPAVLVATDNGDLMDLTPYNAPTRDLWRGQVSAVIRLTGEPGQVTVYAEADGLQGSVDIDINL